MAKVAWRRSGGRLAAWEPEIVFWGRAAYGVLPLYGGWITGAVSGPDCGITGIGLERWAAGAAGCAVLLLLSAAALRVAAVRRIALRWYGSGDSWFELWDEPRWSLYRGAAAAVWSPAWQIGGFLLGGIEWLIRSGRPTRGMAPQRWSGLIRLTVSAVLFAITRNLWLTVVAQAAFHALLQRRWIDPVSAG